MKNLLKLNVILIIASTLFVACEKEEDPQKLTISDVVAENHDGGVEVQRGGTISVNFTATAGDDARLDFYHIEIHDHPESGLVEDEYRIIDASFKDEAIFKGLREAHVHEHVTVPDNANLGEYHVVIVVVDEAGNSVDTENGDAHIEVVE
ncbi:MAG TPA: hypothetical protein DDX98_10780 [Bacteroidales bacterium]|jgi:hypothetical protein|nr:hypothetical protein [Bacteroidales bacterium]